MSEFLRCYRLTVISTPTPEAVAGLDRSFFEEQHVITTITDLDVDITVEKNLKEHPNRADLKIYNLASRDEFVTGGPAKVRIEAGYSNTPRLLFVGDVRFASHEFESPDWVCKVQLADGGRAFQAARVNRSYKPGTPFATIVGDACKALGVLRLPQEIASISDRVATGEVLSGSASDELTRLLAPYGLTWSFQSERLQVMRADATVASSPRIIEESSGMLGAPVIDPPKITAQAKTASKKTAKVPKLKVSHLLYPELTPGERIEVRSRSINGDFKIVALKHKLSTRGDDWTTEIEATS